MKYRLNKRGAPDFHYSRPFGEAELVKFIRSGETNPALSLIANDWSSRGVVSMCAGTAGINSD